eukprot:2534_1
MLLLLSITVLFSTNLIVNCDLSDYIGFGVSTNFQSSPVSDTTVGSITSKLNAKTFRIYGWPNGPSIAEQIINQSHTPSKIKLMIDLFDVNSANTNTIDNLLSSYSSVRSNVYYITLGNEPLLNPSWMTFDLLAEKLQLFYQHLSNKSEWSHVKVTIPFSFLIFHQSWPVTESFFKHDYRLELIQILNVLKQYNGPFSMNIYPFFNAAPEYLQYALGNKPASGGHKNYNTMLESQYDSVKFAIKEAIGDNNIEIMITETGWSSASNIEYSNYATKSNAENYILNTLNAMNNP